MSNYTSLVFWPKIYSIVKYETENKTWDNIEVDDFSKYAFNLREGKLLSLFIQLPIICEGFLKTVIRHKMYADGLFATERDANERKLANSWSNLHSVFNNTFPRRFKQYCDDIDSHLFEDLRDLFRFRNLIGHGQEVAFEYDSYNHEDEYIQIMESKFLQTADYLKSRGILDADSNGLGILSDENVLLHYMNVVERFFKMGRSLDITSITFMLDNLYRNLK